MYFGGFVLATAIALLFFKLRRRTALWWLGKSLWVDIGVTILMTFIHWGTFSGLMAAAFAGLVCSGYTWLGRWAFGYIEGKKFYPGKFHVKLT